MTESARLRSLIESLADAPELREFRRRIPVPVTEIAHRVIYQALAAIEEAHSGQPENAIKSLLAMAEAVPSKLSAAALLAMPSQEPQAAAHS